MPAASVSNGQFSLLFFVESAHRRDDWYRVTYHRALHALGCDCASWTFQGSDIAHRYCKHTQFVNMLIPPQGATRPAVNAQARTALTALQQAQSAMEIEEQQDPGSEHPYIQAILTQFPNIHGSWEINEKYGNIAGDGYRIVQVRLQSGNGDAIQASIAFAQAHHRAIPDCVREVAIYLGYAISLELAHRRGIPIEIQAPRHYSPQRSGTRTRQPAPAVRRNAPPSTMPALPSIAYDDIMRVSGSVANGRTPAERAEGTLRLLLGDSLYRDLETNGFLDVQSVLYADQHRVYRLRRDRNHQYDRRVRVFEEQHGVMTYCKDFCIVRANNQVPEADGFISKWLAMLSDERRCLAVVQRHNIFSPHSDSSERETRLPVWREPALVD